MDRNVLADMLFNAAQTRARTHGVRFGPGAENDIRRFAEQGAERILSQQSPTDQEDTVVANAESVFEKLVDEMVHGASEIEGYRTANPGVIGEQTLSFALSRLCPCFPIC